MGSRVRENVIHLFECFCEVAKPGDGDAWIIQKFPDRYKDEEVLKSVPKFAYPCEVDNSVVQHYSFVLTNVDSKWTFGFCRHDPKSETALVILSYLPWHEAFYKLLNIVSELLHGNKSELLWTFLHSAYSSRPPEPGHSCTVPINNGSTTAFVCSAPKQFVLPSIPENRNLTEYYNAVDSDKMIGIFASMLCERRIVVTSRKLSRLSCCVQAANAVIYPMSWQHIYIPVLPSALADYLLAPMPYLIGVPHPLIDKVYKPDVGEVVVLDADTNTLTTPFKDVEALPHHVVRQLKSDLKQKDRLLGDGVSRAFLRALVALIGGYRDALRFTQGQRITFDEDAFIQSRPPSSQPFLRSMLNLQIFQQFIEERLTLLNAGLGFSDQFELETCNYCDKTSSRLKAQYKDWTHTMRREGSAFLKNVKTKAKSAAVKSAVKTVKERGKDVGKAYKGIRTKIKELGSDDRTPRPRSHLVTDSTAFESSFHPRLSLNPTTSKSDTDSGYCGGESDPSGLQLSPIDMDLMGDLHHVLFNKNSLLESGSASHLKPVRSLENFSTEYLVPRPLEKGSSNDSVFLYKQKSASKEPIEEPDLIVLDDSPPHRVKDLPSKGVPKDSDLLLEYGLDFSALSVSSAPLPTQPMAPCFQPLGLPPVPGVTPSQLQQLPDHPPPLPAQPPPPMPIHPPPILGIPTSHGIPPTLGIPPPSIGITPPTLGLPTPAITSQPTTPSRQQLNWTKFD